jgi:endonuclease/exonuclease/phosphatase family metal-dependent hydrolase
LLKAKLDGGITVLVIHFGLNSDEQKNAVKTVLENIEKDKCILMGDFNVTPTSVVLSPITKVMQDTASFLSEQKFSFPSDNPRIKIDYIFVSKDVKVVSAEIPADIVSDHLPYIAKMDF